jgi:hypothetical protein
VIDPPAAVIFSRPASPAGPAAFSRPPPGIPPLEERASAVVTITSTVLWPVRTRSVMSSRSNSRNRPSFHPAARPFTLASKGIALAIASLVVMPILARAKRRVARMIASNALAADAKQTQLCMYLSAILLRGLILNAAFGWWWTDPAAGLLMIPIVVREGMRSDILFQFLLEAVMLSVSGGLVGVLVRVAATLGVAYVADWQAVLVPETLLLAVACSAAIRLLFGTIPVRKASLANPREFVVCGINDITHRKLGRAFTCRKWKPRSPYTR